jgi:hypothetical protein
VVVSSPIDKSYIGDRHNPTLENSIEMWRILIHAVGFESKISVCRHPATCIPPTLPPESITPSFSVYSIFWMLRNVGL